MVLPLDATVTAQDLAEYVRDARERTFELVADLTDEQLMGPRLSIVNPMLWEIGHMAWFQGNWVLGTVSGNHPTRAEAAPLYARRPVPPAAGWTCRCRPARRPWPT